MAFKRIIFFFLLQCIAKLSCQYLPPHHSINTDKAALLVFKRAITYDPHSILSNWNKTTYVCNFTGIKCNHWQHRVSRIILTDTELEGSLSPVISNLTHLRALILTNNNFFGKIPPELSSLRNLSWLWLEGNKLTGNIPESFSLFSHLTYLNLRDNKLTGVIPTSLFSNCTLLTNIDLSVNSLSGEIPSEIGNCGSLLTLELYNNQLTGVIPLSLANASHLRDFDAGYTNLSGLLPSYIVSKLPELVYLHLSYTNMFSHNNNTNLDPFFNALANRTSLKELLLAGLGLGGTMPKSMGRLSAKLRYLFLKENNISGSVPSTIANLTSLTWLNLTSNLLSGTIPSEIAELSSLEQLFFSHNFFSGEIPSYLGELPHLGLIDLSYNRFSGEIPKGLCNPVINFLFLNNNLLSGSMPRTIGQCRDLSKLDLSHNQLTGVIPTEISNLREIRIFLNLSHNLLNGSLPIELSKLENVLELDLSSNYFTGNVISQLGSCISLTMVNLSHNLFHGKLPEALEKLVNLEKLDISHNFLSGEIPESLNKISALSFLNLSFNEFNGKIPSGGIFSTVTNQSFLGHMDICGSIPGISKCHRRRINFQSPIILVILCIIVSLSVLVSIICCGIACRHMKRVISVERALTIKTSPPEIKYNFPRITYKELFKATLGFSGERLIGSGGQGHVYRGVLSDGTPIAVKVLQLQTSNSTKSFNRECQVLKRIRHRNLTRIITACSLPDFKAIVLPYMANGSLDFLLYPHSSTGLGSSSSGLSLVQRVSICSDIADGMAYLHHHSPVRVIHCDLKPSNVLLNDDMTAVVSDFGIARLIMTVEAAGVVENMGNSTANLMCGSVGYIAPEYGFGCNATTEGDVYSFGILILEMVTRKRPTDDMFMNGLSLHTWVKSHYHGKIEKVVDSSLLRISRDQSSEVMKMWEVAIFEMIELGILCTQHSPATRPTMLDLADDLDRLERYLTGDTTITFDSSLGISSSTISDYL